MGGKLRDNNRSSISEEFPLFLLDNNGVAIMYKLFFLVILLNDVPLTWPRTLLLTFKSTAWLQNLKSGLPEGSLSNKNIVGFLGFFVVKLEKYSI